MGASVPGHRRAVGFALLLVWMLAAGCITPDDPTTTDGVPVGLLLPFTGSLASSGPTIERAVLLAVERINDAGGVGGQSLRTVTRDTHSERREGLEAAAELLDDSAVTAMLGPINETLAKLLLDLVRRKQVLQICGGITSPTIVEEENGGFWYRTNPSSTVHGRVLVERMITDGVTRAVVIAVLSEFGLGFARVVNRLLEQAGVETSVPVHFNPTERRFKEVIDDAIAFSPHSVVLAADPTAGARIVQAWALLGPSVRWYLAPPLRDEVFVQNVPQGTLASAVGVASAVGPQRGQFEEVFAERWYGEVPSADAFFHYDAMAVVGLALARMYGAEGELSRSDRLGEYVRSVANPPGTIVTWNDLDAGLSLAAEGDEVNYAGVTGDVDFDASGNLDGGSAVLWAVRDDRIVDL